MDASNPFVGAIGQGSDSVFVFHIFPVFDFIHHSKVSDLFSRCLFFVDMTLICARLAPPLQNNRNCRK